MTLEYPSSIIALNERVNDFQVEFPLVYATLVTEETRPVVQLIEAKPITVKSVQLTFYLVTNQIIIPAKDVVNNLLQLGLSRLSSSLNVNVLAGPEIHDPSAYEESDTTWIIGTVIGIVALVPSVIFAVILFQLSCIHVSKRELQFNKLISQAKQLEENRKQNGFFTHGEATAIKPKLEAIPFTDVSPINQSNVKPLTREEITQTAEEAPRRKLPQLIQQNRHTCVEEVIPDKDTVERNQPDDVSQPLSLSTKDEICDEGGKLIFIRLHEWSLELLQPVLEEHYQLSIGDIVPMVMQVKARYS
ncbi:hypothetical protein Ciccas_005052 [Cichlidogyrus casuarinus]|uniref:Uncharacterized protein n=1 Tax=Cichlidogyrus casuarinus TaxID=1844966 RepID=A0ABD2QA04_9PLAT